MNVSCLIVGCINDVDDVRVMFVITYRKSTVQAAL